MKMTIGKFKGQPVANMTISYLMWLITNEHIRFKYRTLIEEALQVLRVRFENFDALLAELAVTEPPSERWKTAKRTERKKKERVEKLLLLEGRRAAEREIKLHELGERLQTNSETRGTTCRWLKKSDKT